MEKIFAKLLHYAELLCIILVKSRGGGRIMSCYFSGSVQVTADDKNRFRIPAKYKDVYALDDDANAEIFITKLPQTNYLTVFSKEVGENLIRKLNALSTLKSSAQSARADFILQNLEQCKVDNQGRIIIPQKQMNQICLGREAVISGVGAKLRIWNKDAFEAQEAEQLAAFEAVDATGERMAIDDLVFGVDDGI